MLPNYLLNGTIISCKANMAAGIWAPIVVNISESSFATIWKIDKPWFHIILTTYFNIVIFLLNVHLGSSSRLSKFRLQCTYSSCPVSLLELLSLFIAVTCLYGLWIPFCLWSVGVSGMILFPLHYVICPWPDLLPAFSHYTQPVAFLFAFPWVVRLAREVSSCCQEIEVTLMVR